MTVGNNHWSQIIVNNAGIWSTHSFWLGTGTTGYFCTLSYLFFLLVQPYVPHLVPNLPGIFYFEKFYSFFSLSDNVSSLSDNLFFGHLIVVDLSAD